MGAFGGAAHRVAVAVADAVALVDEIEMRVDLDDVDRAMPVKGRDGGDVDRMIPAQQHRQRPRRERRAHRALDAGMALGGVGVDDVGIAHVDHLHPFEIGDVVLVIIRAGMAEGEERRGLADRPRPEARPRAPLGAHVERRTEHRHIGAKLRPVGADGALGKAADAHERKIEPSGIVSVRAHPLAPLTARVSSGPRDPPRPSSGARLSNRSSAAATSPSNSARPMGSDSTIMPRRAM